MEDEIERIKERKLKKMLERMEKKGGESLSKPIEVTDENFDEVIRKNELVVIDCWAPWCMPCRMIAPVIDELARDYAGKVVFGKLNTDENRETVMRFGIMSIPTLLIFKNGKLVDKIIGAVPRQFIESKLSAYMS
ncbi:MAG: thioredoxin 1 [Archaeoglobi archaeon]|nr:thioredoxin 1 [Archaeoglobi archaeon]MDK2781196.1 thioredoxin 1 [Archaeoglobi archaeon]